MGDFFIGTIAMIWIISPAILLALWLFERAKRKKTQQTLQRMAREGRLSPQVMQELGVPYLPPMPPQGCPMQTPVIPQPPMPPQANILPTAPVAAPPPIPQTESPVTAPQPVPAPVPFVPPTYHAAAPPRAAFSPAQTPHPAAQFVQQPFVQPMPQQGSVPPFGGYPQPFPPQPMPSAPPRREVKISAITAMLAVGVLLIVVAGLLFIRSTWGEMGNLGKLAVMGAGSVLFFGASALANKVFKLERTGMAFFFIGAAFLPISIWGAGYFGLLGNGLSGGMNNLLISLSFLAFTIISLIAVHLYKQTGWGIATLFGVSLSYLFAVRGFFSAGKIESDFEMAIVLICTAAYALLLGYGSRLVKQYLPLPLATPLEPFTLGFAFAAMVSMTVSLAADGSYTLYGIAAMLTAALFFAPALTERLKEWSALPVAALSLLGFSHLFDLVYGQREWGALPEDDSPFLFYGMAYFALILTVCTLLFLVLLMTGALPDHTKKGYQYGAWILLPAVLAALFCASGKWQVMALSAAVLLMSVVYALRSKLAYAKGCAAAAAWMVCWRAAMLLPDKLPVPWMLLLAGMLLLCFALFYFAKPLHTLFSDFLFLASVALFSLVAVGETRNASVPSFGIAVGLVLLTAALCFVFALAHDTCKPHQYAFAAMVPFTLFELMRICVAIPQKHPVQINENLVMLLWSAVSYGVGLLTYLTTKRRFHGVRRLMFGLSVLPPLGLAVAADAFAADGYVLPLMLLGTVAALALWRLFAGRGMRGIYTASFAAAVLLVMEMTGCALKNYVYQGAVGFPVYMISAVWVILLSAAAVMISKRMLLFVGNDAIPTIMQVLAPITALFLSANLLKLSDVEWNSFFAVFTVGVCVAAWLATKRDQILLPAAACISLIFSLEAVRAHLPWETYTEGGADAAVAMMLFCFAGMTVLFPYLGTVLREGDLTPIEKRRSCALTGVGGVMPFWLLLVSEGMNGVDYTSAQVGWMHFFVPLLIAGFLLTFLHENESAATRQGLITAIGACLMLAFWIQPLVDVSNTYWEGKLHLLPLLAFGLLLRRLYGRSTGGGFLFGTGLYAMLRLGFAAIASEANADLLTVLICAVAIFVASFFVRQKKWFLLGGVSLICIAFYMLMKTGMQWWLYLLIAGMILIGVASANEMLKKRGESLKDKAGRFWEDWEW